MLPHSSLTLPAEDANILHHYGPTSQISTVKSSALKPVISSLGGLRSHQTATMAAPVTQSAWTTGNLAKRLRDAHPPNIETKRVTLSESDYNKAYLQQTIQATLTGADWGQIRNDTVLLALKNHGIDIKSVVQVWKTDKMRFLYITLNSPEAARAVANLHEIEIETDKGIAKVRLRGKATTLEVRLHYAVSWIDERVIYASFQEYGEVLSIERVSATVDGIKVNTGTLIIKMKAESGLADRIPHRLALDGPWATELLVTVEGRPTKCWSCGRIGHLSRKCDRRRTNIQQQEVKEVIEDETEETGETEERTEENEEEEMTTEETIQPKQSESDLVEVGDLTAQVTVSQSSPSTTTQNQSTPSTSAQAKVHSTPPNITTQASFNAPNTAFSTPKETPNKIQTHQDTPTLPACNCIDCTQRGTTSKRPATSPALQPAKKTQPAATPEARADPRAAIRDQLSID